MLGNNIIPRLCNILMSNFSHNRWQLFNKQKPAKRKQKPKQI